MPDQTQTTDVLLREALPNLSRAERQLAAHILGNFPVPALGSVSALARGAGVSGPTVVRLVQRLGFSGYPQFQARIRDEIGEKLASPLVKRDKWAESTAVEHILNRFANVVVENLQATLGQIDHATFDAVADLLADPDRRIYAMGGRITHALADYFASVMKVMRGDVTLMSDMSNTWPPALLDMKRGDVLMVMDIRRYENSVLQVAEMAREHGAEVVLITDRWVSPAAAHATHLLPCHIEAPSAWDSTASLLVVIETLLAAVQSRNWAETEARLNRMEDLFARTHFFRRPR
ncbi:MurR/RpiR family transcriptional regulator [Roseicitreum antarcticum]|uniref:Transcriptional regulator, RpiR family n=1 Tax=Roseicitreum antarcticum TaxID=564137 RepID=A0A1H2UMB5_9RHOB|nr:MurR/RpiR family transcriptional regulator [Roseicitreum antarcticum]SDW57221.1 transcriptional regulator, RpiR family [Roseicitreum antarcticum]